MAERTIESYKLERVEEEQKKINDRLDKLDAKIEERFLQTGKDIGQIQGAQNKAASPWFTHFAAPVLVVIVSTAIIAAIPTYIGLNSRLSNVEGYIRDNGGFIAGLRLQQSALNPTNSKDVTDAKQVVETAKAKRIKIDPSIVEAVGKKFVDAGKSSQDAWSAAVALVNYQNQTNPPTLDTSLQDWQPLAEWQTYYYLALPSPTREPPRVFTLGGLVPIGNAAVMEYFDQPPKTPTQSKVGPEFIGLTGASIILDDAHWRNIILKNVTIIYDGGKVDLERVYFINCTFQMTRRSPNTQSLADAVLSPAGAMSFSTI